MIEFWEVGLIILFICLSFIIFFVLLNLFLSYEGLCRV